MDQHEQNNANIQKEFEKIQKGKVREMCRKKLIFQAYNNFLQILAQHAERTESAEALCNRAMDLARWSELVWLNEFPESEDDIQIVNNFGV